MHDRVIAIKFDYLKVPCKSNAVLLLGTFEYLYSILLKFRCSRALVRKCCFFSFY